MFPSEVALTVDEEVIVFRVRGLIGDEKRTVVDEIYDIDSCANVKVDGSMYGMEEHKGWPIDVRVGGVPVTSGAVSSGVVEVLNYEYLRWNTVPGPLVAGTSLSVVYNHFRYSDLEIINTYDTGATTFLAGQCGLTSAQIGPDLLVLATAYALLSNDLQKYINEAVNLEDSDSKIDASRRPQSLTTYMNTLSKELIRALEAKTRCKVMSLPLYKVE